MDGDIELELASGSEPGEYTVRVVQAPAGGSASGLFRLDVDGILARRAELESTVLASSVAARRTTPVAELPVRGVGQELFQALFTREVYGTYRASLGAAQHSGQQLRVVLRLAAPELAAMPWEMLFDPETESYLCQTEPLLRHIPAPDYHLNPLEIVPPLRILGLIASPRDLPLLDVEAERDHLTAALAGPVSEGRIELVWASGGTWDEIQSMLLDGPWHVVHFIGHGDYDARNDEGRIALVGADGRASMVRAIRFMALLSVAVPRPRLVVLNSCSSGETGREDLFSGTASTLVRSGISAVAAMQFAISDGAAISFAQGFYAAIANGRGVDEAARVGRISVMGSPDGTLEWVTPALYVRGGDTKLFNLKAPGRPAAARKVDSAVPVTAASGNNTAGTPERSDARIRQAELRALYVQACAELRTKHYAVAIELFDDLLTLDGGYRDAAVLRASAAQHLERSEAYRHAREAEDAGDWTAAADGYTAVGDDPDFPDAAARARDCAKRQRTADLQGELEYHASSGNWQAAVDVSAELYGLDPAASDPDGLATRARNELRRENDALRAAQRNAQKAARQAEPERNGMEGPAAESAGVDARLRTASGPDPRFLAAGGAVLAVAGALLAAFFAYLNWVDHDWWYSGGEVSVRLVYAFLAPAGYLLLLLAGLPDQTESGRVTLAIATGAGGLLGVVGLEQDLLWAATATTLAQALFGGWAGIRAIRAPNTPALAGWLLLVCLVTLPLMWLPGEDLSARAALLTVQNAAVGASGLVFLGLALRRKRKG
ncbi:CHAT domain-containing protein [Arthrobacter sp. NPDC058288]|uniref:CHAT domain-containing protein n=1 Tax=Arthrobacter sp. NPDC058288 TaxID=3346424 RepID=UPI0036E69923